MIIVSKIVLEFLPSQFPLYSSICLMSEILSNKIFNFLDNLKSSQVHEVISKMLVIDPNSRIKIEDAIKHNFVKPLKFC